MPRAQPRTGDDNREKAAEDDDVLHLLILVIVTVVSELKRVLFHQFIVSGQFTKTRVLLMFNLNPIHQFFLLLNLISWSNFRLCCAERS